MSQEEKKPGIPKGSIEARLKDTANQEALRELCAPDVSYVSLNHSKAIRKGEKWKCEQRTVTTGVK
jgi:hypothetical protein